MFLNKRLGNSTFTKNEQQMAILLTVDGCFKYAALIPFHDTKKLLSRDAVLIHPIMRLCCITISADMRHHQKKMLGLPTAAFTNRADIPMPDTNGCCLLSVYQWPHIM